MYTISVSLDDKNNHTNIDDESGRPKFFTPKWTFHLQVKALGWNGRLLFNMDGPLKNQKSVKKSGWSLRKMHDPTSSF